MTTSLWSPAAVADIAATPLAEAPAIVASPPILPGSDLWDYWPVQRVDGRIARIDDGTLYVFLAAPAVGDPEDRHVRARLRLLRHCAAGWRDLGPAFAPGVAPGSRQWSGSAVSDGERLTLYFTAVGHRGEAETSYEQRLVAATATLRGDLPPLWSPPAVIAVPGGDYATDMTGGGTVGTIKAFRDPAYFRDPADGGEYLLFAASLAASTSAWNGAIGVARRTAGGWSLGPPLISADGVNNELERPHVVVHDGRYYCFWSTQAKVFAPGLVAPTGLYGMGSDAFGGPWRPLNGTGLVVANPAAAPHQAYSWWVLPDLSLLSFADMVGLARPPVDACEARAHFGGTPAPTLRLRVAGDTASLA